MADLMKSLPAVTDPTGKSVVLTDANGNLGKKSGFYQVATFDGDADELRVTGIYRTQNGVTNVPVAGGGNFIEHRDWDANAAVQTFWCYNRDEVYVRRKSTGVWKPWRKLMFADT